MTSFSQLKGCLFDLHGVIADSSAYHTQAWHQLATDLNVTWTQALADKLLGMSRDDAVATILAAGDLTDAYSETEKNQLGRAQKRVLFGTDPDDVAKGHPAWNQALFKRAAA
ncbi:hypothetical protein [Secundilactobacillus collinoides]|uniref:hypothetical protein n=1 Tax=Secundilactobacillus collinoides TaxID=33960 RepID=UPI0006D1AF88|nr:hypothetical protein [Secundilactobacillus collinoides]